MKPSGKIRKQFILDPGKIRLAKKVLNAKTETETIDKALEIVIANREIKRTLISLKGKYEIVDVLGHDKDNGCLK